MSRQSQLNFNPKQTNSSSASASAPALTKQNESVTPTTHHRVEKRKTYMEHGIQQLKQMFLTPSQTDAESSSSPAATAATSSSASSTSASTSSPPSTPTVIVDESLIRRIYHKHSSDLRLAIDELVELTGRHPEQHSAYHAQLEVDHQNTNTTPAGEDETVPSHQTQLKKQRSTRLIFEQKQGDLFRCETHSALVHCVSECLAMGKGIATLFKSKFGGVDELKSQKKSVGDVAILKREKRFIYYLITKPRYFHKPTLESLKKSLIAMRSHIIQQHVKLVSMPRIGCGLDGLLWSDVSNMIKEVFKDVDVRIVVYTV